MELDIRIRNCNDFICNSIDCFDTNQRGILSQSILGHLRNFVEHISVKIFFADGGKMCATEYDTLCKGIQHIGKYGTYSFIAKFHDLLQISASHYTLDPGSSERLMLKYYEFLLRIRKYMKERFDMDLLENLYKFPLNTDPAFKPYHEAIAYSIENLNLKNISTHYGKFYIYKIKPIFVSENIYYEVTFCKANEYVNKFERIIAFTKHEITSNYAVDLRLVSAYINVFGTKMPITIIIEWEVAVRMCELKNFAKILHKELPANKNKEYTNFMEYLKMSGKSLPQIIQFPNKDFNDFLGLIKKGASAHSISEMLVAFRRIANRKGGNTMRYLSLRLNNKIIKKQYSPIPCNLLSDLFLSNRCLPFENMPYRFSLIEHNPSIQDVCDSISVEGHQSEFLARYITNNTEHNGRLYTSTEELALFDTIEPLAKEYNGKLYGKFKCNPNNLQLACWKKHYYIEKYENNVVEIIKRLKELTKKGIRNYTNTVNSWLSRHNVSVDSEEKVNALKTLFSDSRVAFVYGAAGTGKSTFINYISHIFGDKDKVYLTNTNPAIENLRRKIDAPNGTFMTISKFLYRKGANKDCDIIFIDECSTVSNQDIKDILECANFKLLVLVGDMYQIESILFGNWFSIAYYAIKGTCHVELTQTYRTSQQGLLTVWDKVRNISDDMLEFIAKQGYSRNLDNSIFQKSHEDEIILCLNYDGLYGINNINRFLQSNNPNQPIMWDMQTYKVGDPILFNDSERFFPWLYNNLKGKILEIFVDRDTIEFKLEVERIFNELDLEYSDIVLCEPISDTTSVIKLTVDKNDNRDDDMESDSMIVPFQIAYAVSIHKAQGLEYQSVKVVITHDVEEMITHNILYTAITRAQQKLQIYWSPETEKRILTSLSLQFNKKDYSLLKAKYPHIMNG